MANKLKVQEHEAILNLNRLGWGIRRIARELGVSRNTVRGYVRNLESSPVEAIVEEVLKAAPDPAGVLATQTDPLSTPGSGSGQNQTDPLSTSGNNGRKSLCADHAGLITTKVEAGLSAQRIYQDLRIESSFDGSYQSVKRYVRQLRRSDPELVQRIES